ncbi:hypothetical protein HDU76_004833 [Blyttiomyces sp. JEL0837]|nr:hypothetical protein HDU76_004833 [Blyttiomyces sp. JEL0837]
MLMWPSPKAASKVPTSSSTSLHQSLPHPTPLASLSYLKPPLLPQTSWSTLHQCDSPVPIAIHSKPPSLKQVHAGNRLSWPFTRSSVSVNAGSSVLVLDEVNEDDEGEKEVDLVVKPVASWMKRGSIASGLSFLKTKRKQSVDGEKKSNNESGLDYDYMDSSMFDSESVIIDDYMMMGDDDEVKDIDIQTQITKTNSIPYLPMKLPSRNLTLDDLHPNNDNTDDILFSGPIVSVTQFEASTSKLARWMKTRSNQCGILTRKVAVRLVISKRYITETTISPDGTPRELLAKLSTRNVSFALLRVTPTGRCRFVLTECSDNGGLANETQTSSPSFGSLFKPNHDMFTTTTSSAFKPVGETKLQNNPLHHSNSHNNLHSPPPPPSMKSLTTSSELPSRSQTPSILPPTSFYEALDTLAPSFLGSPSTLVEIMEQIDEWAGNVVEVKINVAKSRNKAVDSLDALGRMEKRLEGLKRGVSELRRGVYRSPATTK